MGWIQYPWTLIGLQASMNIGFRQRICLYPFSVFANILIVRLCLTVCRSGLDLPDPIVYVDVGQPISN